MAYVSVYHILGLFNQVDPRKRVFDSHRGYPFGSATFCSATYCQYQARLPSPPYHCNATLKTRSEERTIVQAGDVPCMYHADSQISVSVRVGHCRAGCDNSISDSIALQSSLVTDIKGHTTVTVLVVG